MKIVINACFGGFGLSYEAVMEYARLKDMTLYAYSGKFENGEYSLSPYIPGEKAFCLSYFTSPDAVSKKKVSSDDMFDENGIERNDPVLIQVVESLGDKAFGRFSKLKLVEIPDDTKWIITEYDGCERVEEKHRTWN